MKIDFTLSFGNIIVFLTVVGAIWRIEAFLRTTSDLLRRFSIEHEILIQDYCKRNNIDIAAFPTRMKGLV